MQRNYLLGAALFLSGLLVGQALDFMDAARADVESTASHDPATRTFLVNLAEVSQLFTLGERFSGSYATTLTMSDGSERDIRLTPMLRGGDVMVELRDGSGRTFMGPNGFTYNGELLINLRDITEDAAARD